MANVGKILGRGKPAADTPATLYTVPAATQSEISLFICNQDAAVDAVSVAVTPSGQELAATDYLLSAQEIDGNGSLQLTGIALAAGDFITVKSRDGNCSFVATGIEVA
jgi:hypothetical protein